MEKLLSITAGVLKAPPGVEKTHVQAEQLKGSSEHRKDMSAPKPALVA